MIIGLNGGTSSSFSASPMFAEGDVTMFPFPMLIEFCKLDFYDENAAIS
jgi:hypothetical protein